MRASVPASTSDITKEWLTDVLRGRGKLNTEVTDLTLVPFGEGVGLMGELARLHLRYGEEEALPDAIVAKCAVQNENRQVARILDFYNREANFYNRVAGECPLRTPASYHADVNQETYDFILLMEDLGDISPRDQLIGASEDEAYSAVGGIAKMHARWWGATADNQPWMYDVMSAQEAEKLKTMIYQPACEPAIEKFSSLLTEPMKQLIRDVGARYSRYWGEGFSSPDTFVHGDYRQDNIHHTDANDDAMVVDWQISGRGKGIFDVAYFMCQSLASDLRVEIEKPVLLHYLKSLGRADYGFEQCWDDYRRIILGCLIYPVTVCGTLDTANERGRALGESMLSRNLAAIEDLGCTALVS